MRVPGTERAFTVSPARGIPFPQLVCIGRPRANHRPFRYQLGRGSPPRAPDLARTPLRPPAAARYCTQPGWRVSGRGGHPALPAHPHPSTHAKAHALPEAPPRCRPRPCGFSPTLGCAAMVPGVAVRSGATGGSGPGTEEVDGRRGWPAGRTWAGSCARSGPARRPARGRRPAHPGDKAELPRSSRDRSLQAAPAPARVPTAKPPRSRRGCDSTTMGPEGRGPGRRVAVRGPKAGLAAVEWR